MPYARGLIDAQYRNYVRKDGLTNYRAEELAQQARMLTILALYHSYSGGDTSFLLRHFDKARALAQWLAARRATSLVYARDDPRHGMIPGLVCAHARYLSFLHPRPSPTYDPVTAATVCSLG